MEQNSDGGKPPIPLAEGLFSNCLISEKSI